MCLSQRKSNAICSFMTRTATGAKEAANKWHEGSNHMFSRMILMGVMISGLALPAQSLIAQPSPAPAVKPAAVDQENVLNLDLSTGGRVSILLYPNVAPNHVERIKTLARKGFYNGIIFHRVIDGFMAQTGDPTGTGKGGSDLPDLNSEFNATPHLRGTVSMARAGDPNSANSQFFICFQPTFKLDKNYTAFGRVISGMQYVDAIARGEPPAQPDRIVQASIGSDNVPPPSRP
jgi:cyclophilin family peptidyl-prolyl cis-trans isomerase